VGNVVMMSSIAQSSLDLNLTIQNLTMAMCTILCCEHATLFLRDSSERAQLGADQLYTVMPYKGQFHTVRFPKAGLVGRVFDDGEPRTFRTPADESLFDASVDLGLLDWAEPGSAMKTRLKSETRALESMMVLPLVDEAGHVFGALAAMNKLVEGTLDHAFDATDKVSAHAMIKQCSAHLSFTLKHNVRARLACNRAPHFRACVGVSASSRFSFDCSSQRKRWQTTEQTAN
jgi:hypothetical protein